MTEERLAVEGTPERFWHRAPDLAVEIVSPSDKASDVQERVLDYLDSGARIVWVVDPGTRSVTVYRSPADIRLLREGDMLDGIDVIPGFAYSLSDRDGGPS
jgi:Uma2 family endonuclease